MSDALFNFHDTILVATIFLSLLFVLLLLVARSERQLSDYFLAGFFACQAAIAAHVLIYYSSAVRSIFLASNPDWFYMFGAAFWLEGPLLFLFTRTFLFKQYRVSMNDAVYFLPTLAFVTFISLTYYALEPAAQIAHVQANVSDSPPIQKALTEAARESIRVMFGVLCILDIRRAQRDIKDKYSNIERYSLSWLTALVLSFVAVRGWILIVVALSIFLPELAPSTFNALGLAGNYLTFALIAMMMFYALQSSAMINGQEDQVAEPEPKYVPDPALTARISEYMATEKPYLKHLLNLDQLARELELNPRALSTVIKHNFETNFYEFVNSYRIDEAKAILEDPSQRDKTMIDIAGECGFNSKATYNTFFKKFVGCTPSEYRVRMLDRVNPTHGLNGQAKRLS